MPAKVKPRIDGENMDTKFKLDTAKNNDCDYDTGLYCTQNGTSQITSILVIRL